MRWLKFELIDEKLPTIKLTTDSRVPRLKTLIIGELNDYGRPFSFANVSIFGVGGGVGGGARDSSNALLGVFTW